MMNNFDKEAFERIERQFTSTNSNPVDRASIRAQDWEAAKRYMQSVNEQGAEPVAWVTPLAYGQQVTFYKPPKPEGFDDNEAGTQWYCRPLVYANAQPQSAGVPEGYTPVRTETLKWLLGEGSDFEPPEWQRKQNERVYGRVAPYWWRHHLRDAMLTTPQPAGDWIKCSERLPTEADSDCDGNVWFMPTDWDDGLGADRKPWTYVAAHAKRMPKNTMIWMPTGLKRPQPPREQGGE